MCNQTFLKHTRLYTLVDKRNCEKTARQRMCRNSYAPWLRLSLRFTFNVHVELIGMEACGGAHFLGRALREQRLEGQLIPAQYVKPHVKTNKSDYLDAEAIAEARRASQNR